MLWLGGRVAHACLHGTLHGGRMALTLTGDSRTPAMHFLPPLDRIRSRVSALSQLSLMGGNSELLNTVVIWCVKLSSLRVSAESDRKSASSILKNTSSLDSLSCDIMEGGSATLPLPFPSIVSHLDLFSEAATYDPMSSTQRLLRR